MSYENTARDCAKQAFTSDITILTLLGGFWLGAGAGAATASSIGTSTFIASLFLTIFLVAAISALVLAGIAGAMQFAYLYSEAKAEQKELMLEKPKSEDTLTEGFSAEKLANSFRKTVRPAIAVTKGEQTRGNAVKGTTEGMTFLK